MITATTTEIVVFIVVVGFCIAVPLLVAEVFIWLQNREHKRFMAQLEAICREERRDQ